MGENRTCCGLGAATLGIGSCSCSACCVILSVVLLVTAIVEQGRANDMNPEVDFVSYEGKCRILGANWTAETRPVEVCDRRKDDRYEDSQCVDTRQGRACYDVFAYQFMEADKVNDVNTTSLPPVYYTAPPVEEERCTECRRDGNGDRKYVRDDSVCTSAAMQLLEPAGGLPRDPEFVTGDTVECWQPTSADDNPNLGELYQCGDKDNCWKIRNPQLDADERSKNAAGLFVGAGLLFLVTVGLCVFAGLLFASHMNSNNNTAKNYGSSTVSGPAVVSDMGITRT